MLNTNIDKVLDVTSELVANDLNSNRNVEGSKMSNIHVDLEVCKDRSAAKNMNICKRTIEDDISVNSDSNSISELVGDSRSLKTSKVNEISSKKTPKNDALPTKKSKNCNLPSDGITERYADKIISNPLGKHILADDDMIRLECSMFNFDIGDINPDVQTVLSNIDVELSDLQRAILTQILTDRMSAFSEYPLFG